MKPKIHKENDINYFYQYTSRAPQILNLWLVFRALEYHVLKINLYSVKILHTFKTKTFFLKLGNFQKGSLSR